ncbi:unnamed protein product [Anisakis simplex]|uniref:Protein kinase domain-containing protein n=1 Tax=Anisakis simplex TaxID=6269 RepID=A0A0M3JXQ0_ANISI|nr:unnamed protein product [Anisakis simplex]
MLAFQQFFETINPLNGFDGKESLETYMWEQSLKVEPKDAEKLDSIKPSRPASVLKSPGIKPPKTLSSVASTSGPSNHYSGYRSSGRGFTANFNTYSPGMFNESAPDTPRSFTESSSQMDERNSHLGMVEINPGYQPRYLGDARRGEASPLSPLPLNSAIPPPPLIPRQRKEKARSGPPSPLISNAILSPSSSSKSQHQQKTQPTSHAPPLYPRRTSPHFFPSPVLPPLPFKSHPTSSTAPASPLSPERCSTAHTDAILWDSCAQSHKFSSFLFCEKVLLISVVSGHRHTESSFVFPPNANSMCLMAADQNRTLVAAAADSSNVMTSPNGCATFATAPPPPPQLPAVPPRRKAEALPAPLPPDAIRVVWSGEASPQTPIVSAVLPLPTPSASANSSSPATDTNSTLIQNQNTPPLYPRRATTSDAPPRPPKSDSTLRRQVHASSSIVNAAYMDSPSQPSSPNNLDSSMSPSSPPPLPPKTYKRQQNHHHHQPQQPQQINQEQQR